MSARGLVAALVLVSLAGAGELKRVQAVSPRFEVSEWRLTDINNNGRRELLLIGADGQVRSWLTDRKTRLLEDRPRGRLDLPEPRFQLVALGDFLGDGTTPKQLLSLSPKGALAYRPLPDGTFDSRPILLARRARFTLRTNEPLFAEVVQDVNSDGKPDVVVPHADAAELWILRGSKLRKAARIAIDIDRWDRMETRNLSDKLTSYFRIPRLHTADVNGDGRRDLLVKAGRTRAFHIQRADGSIPPEPDVVVDLRIFKDATPKATLRPGRILAGSDKTRYVSRDLDGDGIPDYVIAHRRKVWVFHGTRTKPQFVEPSAILKVSDDITFLMVLQLDDDERPDLMLFKVQIPSITSLVIGLLKSFEIDISVLGYRNRDGRHFSRSPTWRSDLVVKVPSILSIMKDPGKLLGRLEEVGRKFRIRRVADLDGDKQSEILLLGEGRDRIDVWRVEGGVDTGQEVIKVERAIRKLIFEDPDKQWDFERMLSFISGVAERRLAQITGGRKPDLTFKLRDKAKYEFIDLAIGDIDGDGADEIVLRYLLAGGSAVPVYDVVRWVK